jgi:two-component system CheB/CheR fusion protein
MADQSPEEKEPEPASRSSPTLVGIGASAGGLVALKKFFDCVPADSGLAFVVVMHLAPEYKSHLADLLQPHVKFPIQQVNDTIRVEANKAYVIPPNANISAIDTHLRLSKLEEQRRDRAPIDHFFRTLANSHDGQSVGVVLTGSGSDGTLGIKEIKAKGGMVIVQDPNDCEYDSMPQSAIATGMVDRILTLSEIPQAILRFNRTQPRVEVPDENEDPHQQERMLLQKVFAQLRARTGRDFSRYKRSTILRRIARRMQLCCLEDLNSYLDKMREQPEEARALADDLLITVTSFFRDPEVTEKLEKVVVPRLFDGKGPQDSVRVWSVGCATGEEAYTLAILLAEQAGRRESRPQVQIFASDLHKVSLDKARDGFYPGDIQTDVGEDRLKRFFHQENGGYRISKTIREMVVFAPHNLLSDPPFSRMDLISCRNLLIYLQRDVQRDVIELFHYSLNPEGTLLLGNSETLDAVDLFSTEDKHLCLFRKRDVRPKEPRLPVFPLTSGRLPGEHPFHADPQPEVLAYGAVHQRMVEQYAPPSILVSPDDKLVHVSEHAGRYLVYPGGELTANIFKLLREELRVEMRGLLYYAREKNQPLESKAIPVRFDGDTRHVVMQVRPARDADRDGFALVIFDERQARKTDAPPVEAQSLRDAQEHAQRVEDLEAEIDASRQRLHAIIEEYETSQEEMKASNEELQSTNEELRSTMEELETSKEELQSINEELQSVNQENRYRVEELAQLSSDLQNLLVATDIATLFLDLNLRILRFSPKLGELFNIRTTDHGRPISDLTHRLGYPELRSDAATVLNRMIPIEREIQDDSGRWFMARVLPYHSAEGHIEGVVITFFDITSRRLAEDALRLNEERLRRMFNVDVLGVTTFDQSTGTLLDCNEAFLKMSGYTRAEVASKRLNWRTFTPPEYIALSEQQLEKLALTSRIGPYEKEHLRKDGSRAWMVFAGASLGDGTIIEYCIDVMDRKHAEQELQAAKLYAESVVDALHEPLLVLTQELRVRSANPAFYSHFHVRPEDTIGQKLYALGNGQWSIPALRKRLDAVLQPGENAFDDFAIEHTFEGIGRRAMLLNARRVDSLPLILLGICDITEKKQSEEAIRRSEERYRLLIESAHEYAIFMLDAEGRVATWNADAQRIFGYADAEIIGRPASVLFTEEDRAAGVLQNEMQTAVRDGRAADDRWQLRKDGTRFWASSVTEALRSDGGPHCFVRVLRDNTELQAAEQSLHQRERELSLVNQALSRANADLKQFAFAAGHDLQEPLRTVRSFSEVLLKAWSAGRQQDAEEALRFMVSSIDRMDHLLEDLLAYSRLNAEDPDPPEPVDLNLALKKTLANLNTMIEQTAARITCDPLPVVSGHETHYIQLFQNLIDNAIKYRNRQPPEVHISAERNGADWRLAVADNGIGIEPQYQEQIFGLFKRLHGRTIPGTGIGLAICKRVVERYGGHIWVESQGRGSTFYFTLPPAGV